MTNINDIKSWGEYWKIFDGWCASLTNQGKTEIVEEFKDAQKYINGLTSGSFNFCDRFKTAYKDNFNNLEFDEKEKSKFLIDALNASLKGR